MRCDKHIPGILKSVRSLLLLSSLLILGLNANAQEFYLNCPGTIIVDDSQLSINEAGEDLAVILETSTDAYVNVDSHSSWNLKNERWRIYIHKSDIEWDDELDLQIKRVGKGSLNGKGQPVLKDGNGWQSIGNVPAYLFRGKDKVYNIPFKFRVMNVSLVMGARDFETDIFFTIYDD